MISYDLLQEYREPRYTPKFALGASPLTGSLSLDLLIPDHSVKCFC